MRTLLGLVIAVGLPVIGYRMGTQLGVVDELPVSIPGASDAAGPRTETRYQWLDAQGNVHVTNDLDEVPPEARTNMGRFEVPIEPRRRPAATAARSAVPKVTIYTTKTCGYCRKAIRDLQNAGVPYIEKDIQASPAARAEIIQLTGTTAVPVIDIDGAIIRGYDRAQLRERIAALH